MKAIEGKEDEDQPHQGRDGAIRPFPCADPEEEEQAEDNGKRVDRHLDRHDAMAEKIEKFPDAGVPIQIGKLGKAEGFAPVLPCQFCQGFVVWLRDEGLPQGTAEDGYEQKTEEKRSFFHG